ncbi:MAG TPA: hypothetical protein VHO70_02785, partial [Chitinispirillaceae bacterium]|nr:hypothetical protein [Chitinispirillaceae bacterium]
MRFLNDTIASTVKNILSGQTTSAALVNRCLNEIAKGNGQLNAFLSIQGEEALKRAEQLDSLPAEQKKNM